MVLPNKQVMSGIQEKPPASKSSIAPAVRLSNEGAHYMNMGDYAKAEPLFQQALSFVENTRGPDDPETATSLNNLGELYKMTGNFAKAEPLLKRALEIKEKALGPEDTGAALSLYNLGVLYGYMGEYTKAEPLLKRSLEIREKTAGPEAAATAASLNDLAVIYYKTGDYAKAEPLYQRALSIREKVLGPDAPDTATTLNTLANLYAETGNYLKAEPLYLRALKIREKALGPEHPTTAVSLDTLGVFYLRTGDYAKAEPLFQRSLSIREKVFGPETPDIAATLNNLGGLYDSMGDYAKAEPLYERSLRILEKTLGPAQLETAGTLNSLGLLYIHKGDYPKAALFLQRALGICEKVLGPDHPHTAVCLNSLAALYERMGDYERAEPLHQRSLNIDEKVLGPDHPDTALSLNNLAALYHRMGDYAKAEPLYQRALNICERVLGADHPNTELTLENLGVLFMDLGERTEATATAEKAERARLSGLANVLSFTSEHARLEYQAQSRPYSLFASLSNAPQLTLAILRHKGIVLDSLLEDRRMAEAGQNPENRALIDQIETAKQRLTQLLLEVPRDLSSQGLEQRSGEREKLSAEVEQLEGTLARRGAGLGQARRALSVTVEQVQAAIPSQGILVELLRYNHYLGKMQWEVRYGAAILAHTGEPKWVCLGPAAAIEDNILRYQQSVRRRTDERTLSAALRGLYQQIWAPLELFLPAGTKTIIISPDASLNFVSFATLLTPTDRFLAQNYSIRYVSSGRDLLREVKAPASEEFVVFASPNYSSKGLAAPESSGLYLHPLPGFATNAAALEAEAREWRWPIRVYLGDEATETQLRAIRSPHILHFSTHGFFLPQNVGTVNQVSLFDIRTDPKNAGPQVVLMNPMHRSGLALAGAQDTLDAWKRGETPPTADDGIVTAEEVGGLHLEGTWLVTLAACDTGVGEPIAGEGVMGLRRGFIQAGTQNLLMTLWPVAVDATGNFMLEFYSALHKDGNPPEALAGVQRDWLVKLREKQGLLAAVVLAGPFVLSSQGSVE